MDDNQFWALFVRWMCIVAISITLSVAAYEICELRWVKPQVIQRLTWPDSGGV